MTTLDKFLLSEEIHIKTSRFAAPRLAHGVSIQRLLPRRRPEWAVYGLG
jgi:hypothetical protein